MRMVFRALRSSTRRTSMIQSTFYILFVVSIIEAISSSYLDSILVPGQWISFPSNSENELVQVENRVGPNEDSEKVVDISKSDDYIKVRVVNADEPIPVDDLLNQLSDEIKINDDDQHKGEIAKVSQQLGDALYNTSIRKAKVFINGIWRVVDLGLAGSSQRRRSAEKANGIAAFFDGFRKWLCGIFGNKDQIPESFDARKAWPECQDIISLIRDQGLVGSCWAVAAASMFSDRLCIASEGIHKKLLSSEDLMRCCETCVSLKEGVVTGGNLFSTMLFMKYNGIVSGGEYASSEGCIPYSYPPLTHPDFRGEFGKNAECDKKCSNTNYKTPYEQDKYYVDSYKRYQLPEDTVAIKKELKEKGSCIASMLEYDDFYERYHKTGIYTRESSDKANDHIIRMIGWGKENGIEYWLVANSRGKYWGDEGIGKINVVSGCSFGRSVWCFEPKVPVLNTETG